MFSANHPRHKKLYKTLNHLQQKDLFIVYNGVCLTYLAPRVRLEVKLTDQSHLFLNRIIRGYRNA